MKTINIKCDYKTINLGIVPTRRDMFPDPQAAIARKDKIVPKVVELCESIHDVNVFTLDGVTDNGLLVEEGNVAKAEKYFREKEIDALFILHINFGQEESVARLAKKLNVPVLLWGPRDGMPGDYSELRTYDSQCGMFASSRALLRYGVKFTYVENCWLDSPILKKGIEDFIRVASVVKAFRGARVLQLSTRPRQFLSVKVNEGELMEKFGIEVNPIENFEIFYTIDHILANEPERIDAVLNDWEQRIQFCQSTEDQKRSTAAVYLGINDIAERYNCTTVATECWSMFVGKYGVSPCLAFAELTEAGLPVCCECDVNGAISSLIVQAATRRETPSFLADITVRHPENDNAELMWHCGPFPTCLAKDDKPASLACQCAFELKRGEITMTRFDSDRGNYMLFSDTGKGVDGPVSGGSYVWFEARDWSAWEKKLMYGPYIHHIAGAYGNYKEIMREASKYLEVSFDSVD